LCVAPLIAVCTSLSFELPHDSEKVRQWATLAAAHSSRVASPCAGVRFRLPNRCFWSSSRPAVPALRLQCYFHNIAHSSVATIEFRVKNAEEGKATGVTVNVSARTRGGVLGLGRFESATSPRAPLFLFPRWIGVPTQR
jgi:hypothetical protein